MAGWVGMAGGVGAPIETGPQFCFGRQDYSLVAWLVLYHGIVLH